MVSAARTRTVSRWAVGMAVAVTLVVAAGAFWLSFAALADLAYRSGIPAHQAWAWPVVVDGLIIAATIALVAMSAHEPRARRYPWAVLGAGAAVSVAANATHALVAGPADAAVPPVVAALVGAVAPSALVIATHLTIILTRRAAPRRAPRRARRAVADTPAPVPAPVVAQGEGAVAPAAAANGQANGQASDALAEWVRAQVAAGQPVTGAAAVRAGVVSSDSTARRRLRQLREQAPELFDAAA